MTQTDPFGNEPGTPSSPTTATGMQFSADTLKQAGMGTKVALVGAVLTFFGAFLPWGKVSVPSLGVSQTASGTDGGDGTITILFAIAVGALCVVQLMKGYNKGMAIGAIVCASITALVGVMNYFDVKDVNGEFGGFDGVKVSVGLGLYLTILAAFAMVAGSVLHLKEHGSDSSAAA